MTDPQRHKLVASGAAVIAVCVVLYLIVFGFHSFDVKTAVLVVGFIAAAIKLSTVKHKRNPML